MTSDIIRSAIFGIAALVAFTFIPAGTLHYWQGWLYVATWILVGTTYTVYVARHDPALLKRRTEAGVAHEQEPAQKIIISFLYVAFLLLVTLPPLDFRFGWSRMLTRDSSWHTGAVGNLRAAAAFAVLAAVAGWRLALQPGMEPSPLLEWHRWLGTIAAGATCVDTRPKARGGSNRV